MRSSSSAVAGSAVARSHGAPEAPTAASAAQAAVGTFSASQGKARAVAAQPGQDYIPPPPPGGPPPPPPPPPGGPPVPSNPRLGAGVSAPTGYAGPPDPLAVELHRMKLSLGDIARERDALRSHVRLLHQQLADKAINVAQSKQQPQRPASARVVGSASSSYSPPRPGSARAAPPAKRLTKEEQKEIVTRMHGPPELVERKKFLKKLEETRKAQSRVKTKVLDEEGLRDNIKKMYETAQMRRKTLESRLEARREMLYPTQIKTVPRSDLAKSTERLYSSGAKKLVKPERPPKPPAWGSRLAARENRASATPGGPGSPERPSSAPPSRPPLTRPATPKTAASPGRR